MKRLGITGQIVVATILGLVVGLVAGPRAAPIGFVGDIFLRLIQMSVVLLIMLAIIEAVGSLSPRDLGKVGARSVGLFLVTSTLGAAVGLVVVNIIRPGTGVTGVEAGQYAGPDFSVGWQSNLVELVPRNVFEAAATGSILQVIVFSILFGIALSGMTGDSRAEHVLQVVRDADAVVMKVVTIAMHFAPIGIFALLVRVVGKSGVEVLLPLAKYLGAIFLGTALVLVIMLGAVGAIAKVNPLGILRRLSGTITVALTTTSSAVSLPIQMAESENRLGIAKPISRLVNPLAMTLNSNGLALTLAVGSVTVAQFFGIELSLVQQVVIVATSVVTTMGNLLVPGGALVAYAIAFEMVGLPLEGVAVLAAVDWFAGIARTLLNVVGDVLVTFWIAVTHRAFDREIYSRGLHVTADINLKGHSY